VSLSRAARLLVLSLWRGAKVAQHLRRNIANAGLHATSVLRTATTFASPPVTSGLELRAAPDPAVARFKKRSGGGAMMKIVKSVFSRSAEAGMAQGALLAFVIKLGGSSLNIVMFTIAARVIGPAEFGQFAIWFNLVSFLAVIALCGQETLIVRSWNEYIHQRRFDLARGAISFGVIVCAGAALFWAGCVAIGSSLTGWASSPGLVVAACLLLIMQTMACFSSNLARTVVGFLFGEGLRETWRLVVIVGALLLAFGHFQVTITMLFALCIVGVSLMILVQFVVVRRSLPPQIRRVAPATDVPAWVRRSLPMWTAAFLDASSQYLDVILLGLLLSPVAAGGYFVAARLANIFAMIAGGMANYSATPIASLFFTGHHPELQRSLKMVSLAVAALVVAGLAVIFVGGDLLLMIFGESYVDQHGILVVLSIGTAVAALGGPAMYVLLLTGHEGLYSRVVVVGLVLRVIALVVLTPRFGAIAAAFSWSACLIGTTIALNAVCRRSVGIDPSVITLLNLENALLSPVPAAAAGDGREGKA
jgi:O-antigen/teichoic acid export membrane protein